MSMTLERSVTNSVELIDREISSTSDVFIVANINCIAYIMFKQPVGHR